MPDPDTKPENRYEPFDGEPSISRNCEGCGERIRYRDIVRHDADEDQWWHEGCDDSNAEAWADALVYGDSSWGEHK